MSGHSHFSTIKHKKAASDAKRSKIFSKISRQITIATKEKGKDLETNPGLRLAVETARTANMPSDNIERAIKKGAGELEGEQLEQFIFEAYGPNGVAIIVEGITDNKNRSLGEIKQILSQRNGKLANEGSVKWMFERKGIIIIEEINDKETLEITAIEAGADDFSWQNEYLEIYTKPEELEAVKKSLIEKGANITSSSLGWKPNEGIVLEDKQMEATQKLFEALDDNDAVQTIYSNLKTNA